MGADSVVIAVNVDCTAAAMAMGHASALCNRQGVRCDGKDSVKPSGSAGPRLQGAGGATAGSNSVSRKEVEQARKP